MCCARWLGAVAVTLVVGCREPPRDFTEGTLENAESAWQPTPSRRDRSTDPPVSLLDVDSSVPTTTSDERQREPASESEADAPPHDAGVREAPPADDGGDAMSPASDAGAMSEPDPPSDGGSGGLVGTVCDLLGGLLCPVGLLCVDGLCQAPN